MHKDFKCLEVNTGCIYISRDVIFDENIYPFANLHSNAGVRLRSEISLLPDHLLPAHGHGGGTTCDSSCANPANEPVEDSLSSGNTLNGENSTSSSTPVIDTGAGADSQEASAVQ
jgi:hypothetical protein